MRRTIARRWPPLLVAAIIVLSFLISWAISLAIRLPSADDFNVVRWELQHIPNKWLYLAGRSVRGRLSATEEDRRLGQFLELSAQIDALQAQAQQPGTPAQISGLERARSKLTNDVEAMIEGRITSVLDDEGLASSLPLFPAARLVFPPVDTEFADAPDELVVSPRDKILLTEDRPLSPSLSPERIDAIEQGRERGGKLSALIEPLGGFSTYPSIVTPTGDYRTLVELAAHEWTHQYLFFKPLGSRYLASVELQTLNETVATIAGEEIAAEVVATYPLPPEAQRALAALRPRAPQVNVDSTLRTLRQDVDRLLADGQVTAAEALMEQRRQELASQGLYFRRINQAFFAFENVYATSPASTDPIGAKMQTLLARERSIGPFLRAASKLTSAADLDRLLAATAPGGTGH